MYTAHICVYVLPFLSSHTALLGTLVKKGPWVRLCRCSLEHTETQPAGTGVGPRSRVLFRLSVLGPRQENLIKQGSRDREHMFIL